jgi:hypothetical protein
VKSIVNKLQQIDEEKSDINDLMNFILSRVSEEFSISIIEIKESNRRGIVAEAKKMCIILFCDHLPSYSYGDLSRYFDRSKSLISKHRSDFDTMKQNATLKQEKEFIEKHTKLNGDIEAYLKKSAVDRKKKKIAEKQKANG